MDGVNVPSKVVITNPITKLKAIRGYQGQDVRPFERYCVELDAREVYTQFPQYTWITGGTNIDGTSTMTYLEEPIQALQQECLINIDARVALLEGGVPTTLQSIGTSTSLTNATLTNLASVTLTPGTWSVQGTVLCTASALAVFGSTFAYLEVTGETAPWYAYWRDSATLAAGAVRSTAVPSRYLTVAANTVVTLRLSTAFTLGTATGQGFVQAIKVG